MPRPKRPKKLRTKDSKKQNVTVSSLPVIKCRESGCSWSKAILPGQNASRLLTDHYRDKHV